MKLKFISAVVLFLVLATVACAAPTGMDQPMGGVTATPTVKNTPVFVTEVVNTATPAFTPTVTITPSPSIREVPCEDDICVIPDDDWDLLGRLCAVEVRGFGSMRDIACASVISTVFARMNALYLSDGTVLGTIVWGCKPDSITCEFPAHVWYGCEGIQPDSCAWSYPNDILYFTQIAKSYLENLPEPSASREANNSGACLGYLYYGSSPEMLAKATCVIESESGQQIEGWHDYYVKP